MLKPIKKRIDLILVFPLELHHLDVPENLIVNYGGEVRKLTEVRQIYRTPHRKTTPHVPTGKPREDRVGSSGCLHPEIAVSPRRCPRIPAE